MFFLSMFNRCDVERTHLQKRLSLASDVVVLLHDR